MDVMEILDALTDEICGRKGLFGKKPDLERCAELLEALNKKLPAEIEEARYVAAKRKEILDNADSVAKNTVRTAEEKAARLVSQSDVVRDAQAQARKIVEGAYSQCDALIVRTKSHLDIMFKETEDFLVSNLNMIHRNREELRAYNVDGKKTN